MIKFTEKEIYSTEGLYINRIGTNIYFKRANRLPSDMEEIFKEVSELPTDELGAAKAAKIFEIDNYDTSDAVNSFTLDGESVWLDKNTRVGLMNSTQIQKAAGQETTTLWFGGKSYTIPCDTAIQMLSALELYALGCYNVTAEHKAAVEALEDVESIEAYDYTTDYPEMLVFTTK